jgi:hypothetical protein
MTTSPPTPVEGYAATRDAFDGDARIALVADDCDKTGLPDPLVPTHSFTVGDDGRIVRLIIIRTETTGE